MLTRTLAIAVLLCTTASTFATTVRPMPPVPPVPRVRLPLADPLAQPAQLQQLAIHAVVRGGMAETRVKMVFYNPNQRQMEGNLQFPLADGQRIDAFALDIAGKMRAAVPVDKDRGREVFEAIERRNVDPGLLEVTQGNNFKLRVYPLPPKGTRTVELRYTEALARRGEHWVYRVPLEYGPIESLQLTIDTGADKPVVGPGTARLAVARGSGRYMATLERGRGTLNGSSELLTPAAMEARVYRQQRDNVDWFLAEVPVQPVPVRRTAPKVIGLLWDSSGSGAARQVAAELDLLDQYFSALGNVEVRLQRLRDRPEAVQTFRVSAGKWDALRRALEATVYDGASALADWHVQPAVDQYLLFSDGLSNYGGARAPALGAHQHLHALNSATSADSSRLAGLAERNRGQLIAVRAEAPAQALQALLYEAPRLDAISARGATDIEIDSNTIGDGMLLIAGRMLAPEARLTMVVSNGGKRETIELPIHTEAATHPQAASSWAGFRLRRLDADFDLHRAEIARIGRRFGLATRETSLIVLEELEDYVRYQIEPPDELMADYRKLRSGADKRLATERGKHFEQVVRMYEQRKAWWNAPVPKIDPKATRQRVLADTRAVASERSEMRMMAPPVAAAAAAPALRMGAAAAPVMVTGSRINPADIESGPGIGIELKKWVPNAPYVARLTRATADQVYRVYLDQKPDYANSSAFFLDAADILLAKGQRELALRVLSNLSEMDLENRAVLRILGYRLLQAGEPALAVPVFEQVLRIAQEEPQSFRDLGLVLAAAGKPQQAIDTLYEVILRPWEGRFPDIETITLAELNAIVAAARTPLDVSRIDRHLLANLPLDLRVILTWDADNSDMDLYVTDPTGERCDYTHKLTRQGGRMSNDFTGGYGPEEFALRRAMPGKYKVEANFYGNRQQVVAGATTLQVKLFSGFGTPRQKEQLVTLRLKEQSETVFVGEFDVKP